MSPRLPFQIDDTIDPTSVTDRAGVPLVIELFRQLGVAAAIGAEVAVKQRQRGLPPSQLVEGLIALWASGGDRCRDLTTLREDQALATGLGHPLPAATTIRDFLEAFHFEGGSRAARRRSPWSPPPLAGLCPACDRGGDPPDARVFLKERRPTGANNLVVDTHGNARRDLLVRQTFRFCKDLLVAQRAGFE